MSSVPPSPGESPQSDDELLLEEVRRMLQEVPPGDPGSAVRKLNAEQQRLLREVIQEQAAIEAMRAGKKHELFKWALDVHTEIVTDPARSHVLAERHNAHLVGSSFAYSIKEYQAALEALAAGPLTAEDREHIDNTMRLAKENIDHISARAKKNGFFIFEYDENKMRRRLAANYRWSDGVEVPQYVIVEASGRHPAPEHPLHNRLDRYADCQFHMAPPANFDPQKVRPVVRFPRAENIPLDMHEVDQEGLEDEIVARDLTMKLIHERAHVANIADIVSAEALAGKGLAATALDTGLGHIIDVENPRRRGYPIKYVTAEIASLKGIELPDGTRINLDDLGMHSIFNDRSADVFDHFKSPHCSSFNTAYKLRQKHPIALPGDKEGALHKLIVTWHVKMAFIKS